jgi:hypothetical protein
VGRQPGDPAGAAEAAEANIADPTTAAMPGAANEPRAVPRSLVRKEPITHLLNLLILPISSSGESKDPAAAAPTAGRDK